MNRRTIELIEVKNVEELSAHTKELFWIQILALTIYPFNNVVESCRLLLLIFSSRLRDFRSHRRFLCFYFFSLCQLSSMFCVVSRVSASFTSFIFWSPEQHSIIQLFCDSLSFRFLGVSFLRLLFAVFRTLVRLIFVITCCSSRESHILKSKRSLTQKKILKSSLKFKSSKWTRYRESKSKLDSNLLTTVFFCYFFLITEKFLRVAQIVQIVGLLHCCSSFISFY